VKNENFITYITAVNTTNNMGISSIKDNKYWYMSHSFDIFENLLSLIEDILILFVVLMAVT
jgi:hypothetical protein